MCGLKGTQFVWKFSDAQRQPGVDVVGGLAAHFSEGCGDPSGNHSCVLSRAQRVGGPNCTGKMSEGNYNFPTC